MKIAILTDSGSAFNKAEATKKGLFFVPLQVIDGNESFQDSVDITTKELYVRLRNNHTPKTSMPMVQVISDTIKEIKEKGYDTIIAVPLSSGLSGTFNSIKMCATEEGIPISILENYTTCNLEGYIALLAKELVDKGQSVEEILHEVNKKVMSSGTIILPNDIQHLKRGGRLTPLAAVAASMLKIKPILKIDPETKGKIDVFAKVRTERKATNLAISYICDRMKGKEGTVYVIHSDDIERATLISNEILKVCPTLHIKIDYISAVISAHTGLDCVAIQYIEK